MFLYWPDLFLKNLFKVERCPGTLDMMGDECLVLFPLRRIALFLDFKK